MKLTKLLAGFMFFVFNAGALNAQENSSVDMILKNACAKAKLEKKNVFIMFTASWCVNCFIFKDEILADTSVFNLKNLFDKNYVIEYIVVQERADKKHLENPGGNELLTKYTLGRKTGIPFWIILNKKGKLLADSFIRTKGEALNQPGENIGRPFSQNEVDAFVNILKRTSSLSEQDLQKIRKKCNPNL